MKISRKNNDASIYKKRHHLQWTCVVIIISIIIISMITDFCNLALPQWIVQKTGNDDIYQTLFAGLASMTGIVMAIIALLMNTVGSIVYGVPVAKYIMILRPIKPLRYKWVVIEVIILAGLIWITVAYKLNNIAVTLFIAAVSLLIYLAVEVIRVMHSAQDIESEIRTYILESENFQHAVNLFRMIENSISIDDIFSFRRDVSLAKELLKLIPTKFPAKENTILVRDLLFNITCAANRTQFSNSSDVLDLLITAVTVDNNAESNSISVSTLDTFEAYGLFGRLSIRSLIGHEEQILHNWHKAFLENKKTYTDYNLYGIPVAANLFYSLQKNSQEGIDKVYIELLRDTLSFNKSYNDEDASELNYLSFSVALFETKNLRLLNVLFGFDGSDVGFMSPICDQAY